MNPKNDLNPELAKLLQQRVSIRCAARYTGWSFRYIYKLIDAEILHPCQPAAPGDHPRLWLKELLWINTPPAERGPNPVTGKMH